MEVPFAGENRRFKLNEVFENAGALRAGTHRGDGREVPEGMFMHDFVLHCLSDPMRCGENISQRFARIKDFIRV